MFCPNCGINTPLDRKFCSGCGLNLTGLSDMLSDGNGLRQVSPELPQQHQSFDSDRGRLFRWGFIFFWGGIVLSALLGIIGNTVSEIANRAGGMIEDMAGLGALVLLIGIGIMIYSRLIPKMERSDANTLARSDLANPPRAIGESPASVQAPFPSVTEHTTYRLDATRTERS